MRDRVVHVAGTPVRVGNVCRQRCCWCGAEIDEFDLEKVMVADGDHLRAWVPGSLLEVVAGNPRAVSVLREAPPEGGSLDADGMPVGWCGEPWPELRAVP